MRASPVCLAALILSHVGPAIALPHPAAPHASTSASPLRSGAVTVSASGEITLTGRTVGRLPLPPGPRRLVVREVETEQHALLHVRVNSTGGRAAELVVTAPPQLRVLFAGSTGPQGVDGEWSRHLQLDEKGLLLFQRRDGLVRCDGAPVFLFPQRYDFVAGRFRPVAALVPSQGLPELVAHRRSGGSAVGEPLNTFHLTSTSTIGGDGQQASNLSAPTAAEDGHADTAWYESLGGSGQGEFLTAQAQRSFYRLKALRIIPGDASSPKRFRESNRLKSAVLHLSPKLGYRVIFPRDPASEPGRPDDPYWIELPKPVQTSCATLVIDQVYQGSAAKAGDGGRTAIAELRFFTELEFAGGLAQLERDLDSPDPQRGETATMILLGQKEQGFAVAARGIETARGVGLSRRVKVLAGSRLPAAATPLARSLPRLDNTSRVVALEALRRLGDAAATALAAVLSSPSAGPAKADAARVLGQIGGELARQTLLQHAGRGPEDLRAGIVDGLGALPDEQALPAVLQAATSSDDQDASRRADLIHALGRLGRRQPASTARDLTALWNRPGTSFEERYRILTSVGSLAPYAELGLYERAALDTDPVLRRVAVEQAGKIQGQQPLALLSAALNDPYPPTRMAAALALVARSPDPRTSRALANRLDRERWPAVALALAEALAWHCTAEGVGSLRRALSRAAPHGLDSRALHSLARCNPPGLADELLALAADRRRSASLRAQALAVLGPTRAAEHRQKLAKLVDALRTEAAHSDGGEVVAAWAINTLAQAAGAVAVEALSDALALDPHESIRLAAATGLGKLCASSAKPVLERARQDAAKAVQRAAEDSLKRCAARWR